MLTRDSIFISYARKDKDAIAKLVGFLTSKSLNLNIWYDEDIRTGDFRDWIAGAIQDAKAMIVILTKDSVGKNSSGWIEREIDMARDSGIGNLILPCFIGDFVAPPELAKKITFLQTVSVPSIAELATDRQFIGHIEYLKELFAGGAAPIRPQFTSRDVDTPQAWFQSDAAHDPKAVSLMLATALLEYSPVDLVVDTAKSIEAAIEAALGEPTEDELAARPRVLLTHTTSERLVRIKAERADLPAPDGSAQPTLLRFQDRNWRGALLTHVWDELDDVREVFFDWMQKRLAVSPLDQIDDAIAQTIGSLAQHDLHSVRHRILNRWLSDLDNVQYVWLAADIIAAAAENDANLHQINDMLGRLARPRRGSRARNSDAKLAAIMIGLGRLALRRPEVSVDVMKAIGREMFFDPTLTKAARYSAAIYGHKDIAEDVDFEALSRGPEPDEPEEPTEEARGLALEDGSADHTVSRAVPAALFLAKLADWADEPATDTDGLLKRQPPIFALMMSFRGMPLLTTENSNRLTLQDLMSDIAQRDRSVIERLLNGFRRAGLARRVTGYDYLARRDMQQVFQLFAAERWREIKVGKTILDPDPYLALAGLVHAILLPKNADSAALVYQGSARFLNETDIDTIKDGGPLKSILERHEDEVN